MFDLPPQIRALQKVPGGSEWLNQLNVRISAAIDRWHITLDKPYPGSSVSVVFPAILPGGKPAVLKIQFPHRESKHESEALRRWNGKGAVRIIDNDPENCVLLIERCEPGEYLSAVGPEKALQVLTALLPRLWIEAGKPFTSLSDEAGNWAAQLPKSWARAGKPFEVVLVD